MKKNNKLTLVKFNFNIIAILTLAFFLMASGCKPKKDLTKTDNGDDKEKEEIVTVDPNIVKSKATLQKLLDNYSDYSIEDKEKIIANIKALDLKNTEIDAMITKLETKIAEEKEKIRKEKEEAAKPENRLKKLFDEIATASSEADANTKITEALKMFSSSTSNVFIIISMNGDVPDYDKPSNITKYLNYLKDTKTNTNTIEKLKYNDNNKITSIILTKLK